MNEFNLEEYLSSGVKRIIKGIIKASIRYPAASYVMMQYAGYNNDARKLRADAETRGEHIPPFLIASITTSCNLHCKGCYARANHSCFDSKAENLLSVDEWSNIFAQASNLGVSFILLAGGEPFVRQDVLTVAGKHRKILFPIFTNGTMINESNIKLLEDNRNLLPVISIEGDEHTTNERRGANTYSKIVNSMKLCQSKGILFGASITVHKNNLDEVLSEKFLSTLADAGCKAVVYVEYVPVNESRRDIALDDAHRKHLLDRLNSLRADDNDMIFIAFPGDEKSSGGCLAAGRGFFHINAHGSAEPCPFSPYSDTSLRDTSLRDALNSPLFQKLENQGLMLNEHVGGCVLYEQEAQVKDLVDSIHR